VPGFRFEVNAQGHVRGAKFGAGLPAPGRSLPIALFQPIRLIGRAANRRYRNDRARTLSRASLASSTTSRIRGLDREAAFVFSEHLGTGVLCFSNVPAVARGYTDRWTERPAGTGASPGMVPLPERRLRRGDAEAGSPHRLR